jgi:hypothetical protein
LSDSDKVYASLPVLHFRRFKLLILIQRDIVTKRGTKEGGFFAGFRMMPDLRLMIGAIYVLIGAACFPYDCFLDVEL